MRIPVFAKPKKKDLKPAPVLPTPLRFPVALGYERPTTEVELAYRHTYGSLVPIYERRRWWRRWRKPRVIGHYWKSDVQDALIRAQQLQLRQGDIRKEGV